MTTVATHASAKDDAPAMAVDEPIEVSIVMPCLNEADTIGVCIANAHEALRRCGADGEIVVGDNGSTDGSQAIAAGLGARVVDVREKGYGHALRGGIAAARGKFVVMGDADDSYDFLEIPKFVERLRAGDDFVQGCRLPAGGGRILSGAMPRLHQWWGNPMFSALARRMFWSPVHDVFCGLRAFRKRSYEQLDLRTSGMEFATEMIIKASLTNVRIAELPITLRPDGRRSHPSHLKTFRDGWRTLRLFLMWSPRWLFLYPGVALAALGVGGYILALPSNTIGGINFDAHTLLVASLALILSLQCVVFAVFAKTVAISDGLLPPNRRLDAFYRVVTVERGLIAGGCAVAAGVVLLLAAVNHWRLEHFGHLDYSRTMRLVVPGVTLTALGVQTALSGFLLNIVRMRREAPGV